MCNLASMITKQNTSALKELLHNAKNIVITAHKSPDGDSLGSSLGLFHYLKAKNIQATVVFPDSVPDYLKWMPASEHILVYDQDQSACQTIFKQMDLFIALDYNSWTRIGGITEENIENYTCKKIMIDHHRDPMMDVDVMISDIHASSTAELIYRSIEQMGDAHLINQDSAHCMYCGIMTDTGSFRFPSTSAETHRVVADLMDKGARPTEIHGHIYDRNTTQRLKLLGSEKGGTEGFVNYGLSIQGIRMAAFVSEKEEKGEVRISFRSKGDVAVNELSGKYFNGGGHKNAAGGKGIGSVEETLEKIKSILPEYEKMLCS